MTGPRKRIQPPELARSRKVYDSEIVDEEKSLTRLPRARTPEAREAQLAAMAYDLAEKQFREGTASSQVIVHFLKVGSARERVELQKIKQESLLKEAQVKGLQNMEEMKTLYVEAMNAMKGYSPTNEEDPDDPVVYSVL